MSARIGIVNYGMGNLRSVEEAIEHVGAVPEISGDADRLREADGLVLPGVGAFPRAMERIRELGLAALITERVAAGIPVLGVCLGMQLLFESSTENDGAEGLGLLAGEVTALVAPGLKLPHIGWAKLGLVRPSPLTEGIADGSAFYFVHSFAVRPADEEDLLATASYGDSFAAIVGRDNVFGAQFHPEKSSAAGLRMLANFSALCAPLAENASA